MKILGIHADVCHLGGHTRLFLMMMDIFKGMGHDVQVVARTKKPTIAKVDMPLMDPKSGRRTVIPGSEVRVDSSLSHHKLSAIKRYQPLKHLSHRDISLEDIPVILWGTRFLTPFSDKVLGMMDESDIIFCDTEMYIRISQDVDISDKHIQFIHFPTAFLMPSLAEKLVFGVTAPSRGHG